MLVQRYFCPIRVKDYVNELLEDDRNAKSLPKEVIIALS